MNTTTKLLPGESLMDARRRLDRALQARSSAAQQSDRGSHVSGELSQLLTLDEGARFLRFDVTAPGRPRQAFLSFCRAYGVPLLRRGRVYLVDRRRLELAIRVL